LLASQHVERLMGKGCQAFITACSIIVIERETRDLF